MNGGWNQLVSMRSSGLRHMGCWTRELLA